MEEEKQFAKMLYFEEDEINKENTRKKQVFITKRINGEEKHNKKRETKEVKEEKRDIFNFDDEIIIVQNKKVKQTEEKANVRKKVSKKPKKKKKKSKAIVKIITIIILIIVAAIILLVTPIFNITQITVTGNEQVSNERIISLSGLKKGDNIFNNIKKRVITNIEEEPFIESAEITRKLPGTIQIKVTERTIDYQLKLINGYIYINKQGYILEKSETKVNLQIIEGFSTKEEELINGKRLNQNDLLSLNTIIKITDAAKNLEIDDKITSINIENKEEYTLYIETENKIIYIGDGSNIQNKMLYIKTILEKEKGKSGRIFINGDLNKGFKPYFREEEI